MKKIKNMYIIMLIITVAFLIIPFALKIPFVAESVRFALEDLRIADYKSAYLEVLGGLAGSWLAITGAIYTQRMFENEKKNEERQKAVEEEQTRKTKIAIMCKELLWNEIRANHNAIMTSDGTYLEAIKRGRKNYFIDGRHSYRLNNWYSIREKVINENLECAIKVMELYKYYEYLSSFNGATNIAKDKSQLDFSRYEQIYFEVTEYLKIER